MLGTCLERRKQGGTSHSGGLKAVSHLMHSDDQHRLHYALAAIANIAEIVDGHTHNRIIESDIVEPMLSHSSSPYPGVRKEVARSVALLSCNKSSHAELIKTLHLQSSAEVVFVCHTQRTPSMDSFSHNQSKSQYQRNLDFSYQVPRKYP